MRTNLAHILVIEREVAMLNFISSALRQDGHTVTEARGPNEAASIVGRQGRDIDLVLTEADMTPISGFEFMKRITQKGIDIPLLFTTSSPNLAGAIAAMSGDDAVIEKPFAGSALRKGEATFLNKRRGCSISNRDAVTGTRAA
jgi:CheY-like chemotaxis protein